MFSNQKSKRSRGFRVSTLARTTAFKPISVEEDCNGSVRYELIMPAKPQNQVALPSDVESLLKWSTTLFICPKFKEKRRNHAEMVLQAMYDKDVLNYVIRYGNSKPEPGKLSDLVAFLQAINFVAEDWMTQREYKPAVREVLTEARTKPPVFFALVSLRACATACAV